jgi:hypothetical protein
MASLIDPKRIRTDFGTQMRIAINDEVVRDYAEAMQAGCKFPALRAYFDEPNNLMILVDGFHRLAAHNKVRPNDQILVELVLGTAEDARWESVGANKSHGLRRSNEDKRNAVQQALLHSKGAEESDRSIAEHVGVHHDTVGRIRKEMELSGAIRRIESRTVRRGNQVYQQKIPRFSFGGTPPPPDVNCSNCVCYKDGFCTNDSRQKPPWSQPCEDFAMRVDDVARRVIPPPDYDNIVICGDKTRYSPSDSLYENRALKNCLKVYLPSDNPALFAVELRNHWSPEYLTDCIAALKQLLMDQGD